MEDGKRGIEIAFHEKVVLIVVSRCLPDVNGLEVLKTIHQAKPHLPIIFVANQADEELIIAAFRNGAADFLKRPVEEHELLLSIERCLRKSLFEENNNSLPEFTGAGENGKLPTVWHRLKTLFRDWLGYLPGRTISQETEQTDMVDENNTIPEGNGFSSDYDHDSDNNGHPILRASFLGKCSIYVNNQKVKNGLGRKTKTLLHYFLYHHDKQNYREVIMEQFWPNSDPTSARNSLNVAIHAIRRLFKTCLEEDFLLFRDECYFINPELNIWLDVEEFQQNWELARNMIQESGMEQALSKLELAAELYKGDFIEEEIYEEWLCPIRDNLKEVYLHILELLSHYYSENGNLSLALRLCEKIIDKDSCREEVYRRMMICYHNSQQRSKALRIYQRCCEALEKELEVSPSSETVTLFHRIKNGDSEKMKN